MLPLGMKKFYRAKSLQPVIKWTGSKRSQAAEIARYITRDYEIYYELFCGGCSMLFYILNNCADSFKHFVCNDINSDLIALYNLIKRSPKVVSESYADLWNELNKDNDLERKKDFFNAVRTKFNAEKDPCLFFFIMRTTTNGMPRYNQLGEFNNSFHVTRNGIIPDSVNIIIKDWSKLLNLYEVEFTSKSYNEFITTEKDLLYLDPPYFNTKGMYYGTIDYNALWEYLKNSPSDYLLSFDGIAGDESFIVDIPEDLYNSHVLVNSGNSSFRRVIGTSSDTNVQESLYVRMRSHVG